MAKSKYSKKCDINYNGSLGIVYISLSAIVYLWRGPFHRNLPSVGDVVAIVFQISRHTKISNLQSMVL